MDNPQSKSLIESTISNSFVNVTWLGIHIEIGGAASLLAIAISAVILGRVIWKRLNK